MVRIISGAFAVTASLLLLTSASGARAAQAEYVATPANAPTKASFIVRDRLWKCGGANCAGPKSTGNQNTACALAAQRLGTLTAFSANGTAFDDEALARCNKRAG